MYFWPHISKYLGGLYNFGVELVGTVLKWAFSLACRRFKASDGRLVEYGVCAVGGGNLGCAT